VLNLEYFRSRGEAIAIIETWQQHYNELRAHSSLSYVTPFGFQKISDIFWDYKMPAGQRPAAPTLLHDGFPNIDRGRPLLGKKDGHKDAVCRKDAVCSRMSTFSFSDLTQLEVTLLNPR
jgi:hypothetical protein